MCEEVPLALRQSCAIALYTGLRPGELRALTWADVDLEAGTITISKAEEARTGRVKAPKTSHGRRVIPIHPNLVPLLDELRSDPSSNVMPITFEESAAARVFRRALRIAGVNRERLFADNETQEAIDFRSLRDTHATWLALGQVADKVIQRRLGHAAPTTSDRYIKAAEALDPSAVGAPFPPLNLPNCAVTAPARASYRPIRWVYQRAR